MERAKRKTSSGKRKTPSGKLRTKPEILGSLDKMEFSGAALVAAAKNLADSLSGGRKGHLTQFPRCSKSRN